MMRIALLIGPGWNPFVPLPGDDEPMIGIDGADQVDLEQSATNLAGVFARLVKEALPGSKVDILPPDVDEGQLFTIEHDDEDEPASRTPGAAGFDDPRMVGEAVEQLLYDALETDGWAIARD